MSAVETIDWQDGFVITDLGLNGNTIDANAFTADGTSLVGIAEWFLDISTTAVCSGVGEVANSTAGGEEIQALSWLDKLGNTNWNFDDDAEAALFFARNYLLAR
jgi:hypothetical protein